MKPLFDCLTASGWLAHQSAYASRGASTSGFSNTAFSNSASWGMSVVG